MLAQFVRFGLIGVLATIVHMGMGFGLIQVGWHPPTANTASFMVAFSVSFVGHLVFSFADQQVRISKALWRFGFVGLAGFGCNQTILLNLIAFSWVAAAPALIISTFFAAIVTFLLSKFWAFQTEQACSHLPTNSP